MKPLRYCRQAWRPSGVRRLILCLDFDGTLAPLAPRPSAVRVPKATKRLLTRLAACRNTTLAIISGRALADVRAACRVPRAWYAGNHGLQIQGPGFSYVHPAAVKSRPLLGRLARKLSAALQSIPGAWVENKRLTLSVHWRQTPRLLRRKCRRLSQAALLAFEQSAAVRVTHGKCVLEVRPPADWTKADAVLRILRKQPKPRGGRRLVIYAGDDQTDEDAFIAVNRIGGLTVKIGQSAAPSSANYRLKNSGSAARWLNSLQKNWCAIA